MRAVSTCFQFCCICAALQFALLFPAAAQGISLKTGESADINSVYWIHNCQSLLTGFVGVDVLEGPAGVTLSIREQQVTTGRQNCPNQVPGGVVVATAKTIPEKASGTLRYRVRYNTAEGIRQSTHSIQLSLYP